MDSQFYGGRENGDQCRPGSTLNRHWIYSGAPNLAKFRGGCRFDKGGVTKKFEFLRDKNINFLEVLR